MSRIEITDEDRTWGRYEEWHKFLTEKSAGFEKLRGLGYTGYMDFKIYCTADDPTYMDDLFIDQSFIEEMGRQGLSLSTYYIPWKEPARPAGQPDAVYELVIAGPTYYSKKDEASFFNWLENIRGVRSVKSSVRDLIVGLQDPVLDEGALRDLIALMTRYGIDMACLQSQCTEENQHWLKDPNKYWYDGIFGKSKETKRPD